MATTRFTTTHFAPLIHPNSSRLLLLSLFQRVFPFPLPTCLSFPSSNVSFLSLFQRVSHFPLPTCLSFPSSNVSLLSLFQRVFPFPLPTCLSFPSSNVSFISLFQHLSPPVDRRQRHSDSPARIAQWQQQRPEWQHHPRKWGIW